MSINVKNKLFTNQFAPANLDDIALLPRIKDVFKNGLSMHELFYGFPGTGKSTLAKVLAKRHPHFYFNASLFGQIENLREGSELSEFCERSSLSFDEDVDDSIKVVIMDEINGVSAAFFEALKGFMDTYPNVRFVATTNHIEQIPDAILSRFHRVNFNPINTDEEVEAKKLFKKSVIKYFKSLKLECDGDAFELLLEKNFPDYRGVLQDLQMVTNAGISHVTIEILQTQIYANAELFELIINGDLTKPEKIHEELMGKYATKAVDLIWTLDNGLCEYIFSKYPQYIPAVPMLQIELAKYINMIPNFRDPALVMKATVYSMMMQISKLKK